VQLVKDTAGDERETVRTHLLSLFAALGEHDPAVAPARKALARALF
jgi:putative thioredoxin